MTLSTLKTSALAALAVATLTAPSATAALTYATDDLFLAFRKPGNTVTDYVVNIGQASQYRDAVTSFNLNLPGLAADLTTAFGGTTGLIWGVVGTTQNTAATAPDNLTRLIYTSEPIGSTPTASSSQSSPANSIIGMKNYWLTLTASQGTVSNSAFEDASNANAWSTKVAGAFGSPSIMNTIEDPLANNRIDLFRVAQTGANQPITDEGYFSFNAGTVTFTSSSLVPAPEPSTMLFGLAMLGAIGLNRRRAVTA